MDELYNEAEGFIERVKELLKKDPLKKINQFNKINKGLHSNRYKKK
ncbi:MAG TPA: hypothetical protein PLI99_04275 [archaeon]|nr:hypothetical protein [archaeon]